MADHDVGLVDVAFLDVIDRGAEFVVDLGESRRFQAGCRPVSERGLDLADHLPGVEIAPDGKPHVVGMEIILVKSDDVIAINGVDGGILGLAGIGAPAAIDQFAELAVGDLADVVVAPGDVGTGIDLGQFDLLRVEHGPAQDVGHDRQHLVQVLLEHGDMDRAAFAVDAGLDGRGHGFQLAVDPVPGKPLGAAGAQHRAGKGGQTRLGGGLEGR